MENIQQKKEKENKEKERKKIKLSNSYIECHTHKYKKKPLSDASNYHFQAEQPSAIRSLSPNKNRKPKLFLPHNLYKGLLHLTI